MAEDNAEALYPQQFYGELWVSVPFNPFVEVSDFGRVRSFMSGSSPRFLAVNPGGRVMLIDTTAPKYSKGRYRMVSVSRLVAHFFLPNPSLLPCIRHRDGDKRNNHVSNLEWVEYVCPFPRAKGVDHWLTGREVSKATRKAMSEKKSGEKHPKFKGWYISPDGTERYPSVRQAVLAGHLKSDVKGKLYGWSFKPKPS